MTFLPHVDRARHGILFLSLAALSTVIMIARHGLLWPHSVCAQVTVPRRTDSTRNRYPESTAANPKGNSTAYSTRHDALYRELDGDYYNHCHLEAHHEWKESAHNNSFRTPFYQTSLNALIHGKGFAATKHCDSCHNPVGILSDANSSSASATAGQEGVTCILCHSIKPTDSPLENGDLALDIPSVLVDAQGRRIPGRVSDSEILAHLDRHSKAVMRGFYKTSQYCSVCHKSSIPVALNDYKWLGLFSSYDEWQMSSFSQADPLASSSTSAAGCQTCHMTPEVPSLAEPGSKAGRFASHRWLAGNTAIPTYYGFNDQLKSTIDFLKKSGFLTIDIFGVKVNGNDNLVAPLGTMPVAVQKVDQLTVYVVVHNKGIGHSLLPELRDLYEAWSQFTVSDSHGNLLFQSGFLLPNGSLEPNAHSFINRPSDGSGSLVMKHEIWTIRSSGYDNTIQAGRSGIIRYSFRVPANVKGPLSIRAAIEYRHFQQSFLDSAIGSDHTPYPIVELTASTQAIPVTNDTDEQLATNTIAEWERWRDFGIGCMDGLQYREALQAFQHALVLHPGDKDLYIESAIALEQLGRPEEARGSLEHAISLSPDDARSLYYLALSERNRHNMVAGIRDLEKVVAQFPVSRDARRELGASYLATNQIRDALLQFKALQQIDPNNITAHRNLETIYKRLGMRQQANEQAAAYALKRADLGAPGYSAATLRDHPETDLESSPWHIHTLTPMSTANTSRSQH